MVENKLDDDDMMAGTQEVDDKVVGSVRVDDVEEVLSAVVANKIDDDAMIGRQEVNDEMDGRLEGLDFDTT